MGRGAGVAEPARAGASRFRPAVSSRRLRTLDEALVRPGLGIAYTLEPRGRTGDAGARLLAERVRAALDPAGARWRGLAMLLRDCVHCGFCLPTCPTWVLWGEEMDSPRGRIYLMEALVDGAGRADPPVSQHFDRCLGCMACVTSCPSGVQYDRLIELTRAEVEREVDRSRGERLLRSVVFRVFPYPRRMRAALALEPLGRRLPVPGSLKPLLDVAPPWRSSERPPARHGGRELRGARRAPRGLCPARRLRRRQRRNRPGARRRGLRGGRAATSGAAAARSPYTPAGSRKDSSAPGG